MNWRCRSAVSTQSSLQDEMKGPKTLRTSGGTAANAGLPQGHQNLDHTLRLLKRLQGLSNNCARAIDLNSANQDWRGLHRVARRAGCRNQVTRPNCAVFRT